MPEPAQKQPWFPAKTYGWGWGPPTCWQGWLVIAAWLALLIGGSLLVPPGRHLTAFLAYVFALGAALIAVCWLKGEKPRWRWGKE